MFIDASNHFEKVKTQNVLLPEHIDKIVSTYRTYCHPELVSGSHDTHPATIDKYSYVASLDEVEENDYNLNIPRYVDTFEEEDPVDLLAVSQQLQQLEKETEGTDEVIAGFCKELGINTPF